MRYQVLPSSLACRLSCAFPASHARIARCCLQGAVQGPHSIAQFRKWLDSLEQRPDLRE